MFRFLCVTRKVESNEGAGEECVDLQINKGLGDLRERLGNSHNIRMGTAIVTVWLLWQKAMRKKDFDAQYMFA